MNIETYRPDFDRDGWVVVRQFLSKERFDKLVANLDRYIRDVVPGLPDSDAFYQDRGRPETLKQMQRMDQDPFFDQYRNDEQWIDMATALLGEPVNPRGAEWFNKPPGTVHPTPAHQDNYYFNLTPPNALTAWLAIDPVDEENGCLRYLTGSHKLGLRPHAGTSVLGFSQGISDYSSDDEAQETVVTLQPGDLAIHHCETVHRADPNTSATRHRRAFAMVFNGQSCRIDQSALSRHEATVRKQHESMGLETS